MDEDMQIPNMKEREVDDLVDGKMEIQAHKCSNIQFGFDALSNPSGAGISYIPPNPFDSPNAAYIQPPPNTGGISYAPSPPSAVGLSFDAHLSLGTTGSFVHHMPLSCASSFNLDEHADEQTDDVTPTQQLGFGHRIGKKTTRFTLCDWR
ncbi:hypothetical protein M9H77_01410 [Catharanthus roseus]|uniref:Uncharacterized protein n=1 Tax=Catharanthus roseus TaxID=4058 RepID=A0ACC0C5E6_CATRO|nr:hypothetical protein M9H77_01410 [Catharanthus roseus]